MIVAMMDSASFYWTAFGETEADAAAALQAAYDIHTERQHVESGDVTALYGIHYLTIDPTVVYRDDYPIKIKED